MAVIQDQNDLIASISLYKDRHWLYHGYVAPFGVIYLTWLYYTFLVTDYPLEGCLIALVAIFLVQVLMILSCMWSVHVMAWLTCKEVKDVKAATVAKFVPTPNNGSAELLRIRRKGEHVWCTFQKLKFLWDEDKRTFRSLVFPTDLSFDTYLNSKGHETEEQLATKAALYGDNTVDMTIPEFKELFKERAIAPFFVFQVFCVGLWCLDEYWYYSVFTLMMLVVFECTLVNQQLRNMAEIRNMGNKPHMIQVYRCRKWRALSSDQLVIGDIVSVVRSQNDNLVPCDMLLIRGQCIVDESMLTGESVPQMKEPLESETSGDLKARFLNEESDGRLRMLYGGTKVMALQTTPSKTSPGLRAPDNGCLAYVVRTGFNTSQGSLLSTILFGVRRVTANNLETLAFILFLLMFAIAAAAYVWIKGTEDPDRNRYKLFLECTLILTSVVPPELPIELSLAVTTSLLHLTKRAIFCTEPFRIPFGGKVEYCCFDKTGTLTSDSLVVEGVAGVGGKATIVPVAEAPKESVQVLATCHSLAMVDDGMIGDPLEKATLNALGWNLTKSDAVVPKKGGFTALKILTRHHFSSSLKRMSVVAGYTNQGTSDVYYIASVKGAPEVLKGMFDKVPADYDQTYLSISRKGARVLALGVKELGKLSHQQVQEFTRQECEHGLTFAGFVVISCPLKKDSKSVVKELLNASHHVVMITGDNALTACHVAKELRFTKDKVVAILAKQNGGGDLRKDDDDVEDDADAEWEFQTIEGRGVASVPLASSSASGMSDKEAKALNDVVKEFDLCVTGDGLAYLQKNHPAFHRLVLPHVKVFARFTPKQKEAVVTGLRDQGFTVLMCGDGTNDVGALKHAHAGVALLPGAALTIKRTDGASLSDAKKSAAAAKENNEDKLAKLSKTKRIGKRNNALPTPPPPPNPAAERAAKIQKLLQEMEEAEQAQIVKLGDASIAAPFTSKSSSINCVTHVIKQGRCTLVTTLQMFKILALNALILAYSQSVLYLEGIKFSDGQATLQGLLLAGCFLFISRSKPLNVLSRQRPLPNIFNAYTILTVLGQFAVHFGSLYFLVNEASRVNPREPGTFPDLEKEFEPNLLNSTVYMISMSLQVATFAINYRGHPFMESLGENRPLLISLVSTGSFIMVMALGWVPELCEQFSVVDFPDDFRNILVRVLAADFFMSLIVDRVLLFLLGEGKLRQPK